MADPLEWTRRAEETHFWFRAFSWFLGPVIDAISGGRRDLRIVDCGCGTGRNADLLSPYGRLVGFDLSETGTRMTRARGLAVVRADAAQAPFLSGSFDLATSFDVMQCFAADQTAVREMARMLRPGGSVVMTMAALEVLRGDHSELWQEVRRYTPSSARALVEQAGLRVERISFLYGSLFPIVLTVRVAQRILRRLRGPRPGSDIGVPSPPINAALTAILRLEAGVSRLVPAPVGSSLLVVARKAGR